MHDYAPPPMWWYGFSVKMREIVESLTRTYTIRVSFAVRMPLFKCQGVIFLPLVVLLRGSRYWLISSNFVIPIDFAVAIC